MANIRLIASPKKRPPCASFPPTPIGDGGIHFAGHHLAAFDNGAKLALELGHTREELIFRHYRELVRPEQAANYWAIRPAGPETNVMTMPA